MATVSLFTAIKGEIVVGSDDFLDQIVVWNGSATFNVYYQWGPDRWECVDCFTAYPTGIESARIAAQDYFDRVYNETAEQYEDEAA
jgi:hypothetical protein